MQLAHAGSKGAASAFESLLAQQAQERHARILERAPGSTPRLPTQIEPEPELEPDYRLAIRGFLPYWEASKAMRVDQDELIERVRAGRLEAFLDGGLLYVRPALVSIVAVRQRSDD